MPVNWEAISAIGQIVGAFAVVISLIVVNQVRGRFARFKLCGHFLNLPTLLVQLRCDSLL